MNPLLTTTRKQHIIIRNLSQLLAKPLISTRETILLGPPQIYAAVTAPSTTTTNVKADPFMDLMTASYNNAAGHMNLQNPTSSRMGFTENRSPTLLSSGDPCLDFFFHVVPDTPRETLIQASNSPGMPIRRPPSSSYAISAA
ncbi:OLC1v1022546C1 [Oldenlandia corymbosa var. corymbosa]|uniref:OLC1v1022546C1 n=1 Tax=Oldenlandia corymbosa var. corymbosa TaxID=529605 RepID=A0AAV1C0G3_OLDCO|nr:OLC1v1022546C1 [Oldenlandia corymbosa var. corymbosa]